jgi:Domain of unknown function (DUF4292)
MKRSHWPQAVVGLAVFVASCKAPRAAVRADAPPRSQEKLLDRLLAQGTTARYYSAKADVDLTLPQERHFKAQLRSVLDSALWISITPALGIEMARSLLTADSLRLLDKLHNTYWQGDGAMAEARFGVWPELALLQIALQGKPIGLDAQEKYKTDREDGHYVLTTRKKRRFIRAAAELEPGDSLDPRDIGPRRLDRTMRLAQEQEAIVFRYWLEPDSLHLVRVQVIDLSHDRSIDLRYHERTTIGGLHLPTYISLRLGSNQQEMQGSMRLSRIELEGPLSLPFKVPDKYAPME